MQDRLNSDELPLGLMMRLAQDSLALNRFFTLPDEYQQSVLDGIRHAPTRDDAIHRIDASLEQLHQSGGPDQFAHFDR